MHAHSIEQWQHHHAFLGVKQDRHERRTWFVVALTAVMMIAETWSISLIRSSGLTLLDMVPDPLLSSQLRNGWK
jgi:Co/Zn/Cd efflux system component